MGASRHAWSAKNNKYAISLQYLMKVVSDEVNFLYADKHKHFLHADKEQNILQVGTTFFMVCIGLARHV